MPMTCADCGCLVEQGVRIETCSTEGCCCTTLPIRALLDKIAAGVTAAVAARDLEAFGRLLADDVRWGDDDAPNRCRTRAEVLATFQRLLAEGVDGEVAATTTGRAGVLCHLRIHWPGPAESGRRGEVLHLYRVRDGEIVEIDPYDDPVAAEAALLAG